MPLTLNTSRGTYAVSEAAAREDTHDALVLTISMERADGIEKVALRFRIAKRLASGIEAGALLPRLAHWIERDFEMIRENALKSIRSEGKLMEIGFDESNRGPI